jgi:hypothetical protein
MSITSKDDSYVRLPACLYADLVKIAEREDRSIASAARAVVREGLQHRREAGAGE